MAFQNPPSLLTSCFAGAGAGLVVDLSLFPLDTIKTRLQSKAGLMGSGGFRGIYRGIAPVLAASAPSSAVFFMTYNSLLVALRPVTGFWEPVNNILAASLSELVAGSIRVPVELVKQRKQTCLQQTSVRQLVRSILRDEGPRGLYRGFWSTMSREIPFGAVQYPLWEWFKQMSNAEQPWEIGVCGACAGAMAATVTTPMDVVKTRVMLADLSIVKSQVSAVSLYSYVAKEVWREKGLSGFFAGVTPRVLWITVGGFIYFGMYGQTVAFCNLF